MPIYEFKCPNGIIIEKFVEMGTKEIFDPLKVSDIAVHHVYAERFF
jgi:hypothetical protein